MTSTIKMSVTSKSLVLGAGSRIHITLLNFAPKAHEGFMLGYGKDSHTTTS